MNVALPRLASRENKRKMRRFLTGVLDRMDYAHDLPITVRFTMSYRMVLVYDVDDRTIVISRSAWDAPRGHRETWQMTTCHEFGHAHDFNRLFRDHREEFFTAATGLKPFGYNAQWGHYGFPYYADTAGDRNVYWFGGEWPREVGELWGDCFAEAHGFKTGRNANPQALQVTPELVALAEELAA